MITALFNPGKHARLNCKSPMKPGSIPSLLGDIVCATSDARDAIDLFLSLCVDDDGDVSSTGWMAFDAHVGDTSCQLRACMIMMLRRHIQQDTELRLFQMEANILIQQLESIARNAKHMCRTLTGDGVNFDVLGLSRRGESRSDLLMKLGCEEPRAVLGSSGNLPNPNPLSQTSEIQPKVSPRALRFRSDNINIFISTDASDHGPLRHPCIEGSGGQRNGELEFGGGEVWDPSDFTQAIRLIIYSYVLSKYKHFCRRRYVVGCELDPKMALDLANRKISQDYNTANPGFRPWTEKRRFELDFMSMQNWLAELSCAWQKTLASEYGENDKLFRLMERTTRTSPKGLTAVPSYVGFLGLRQFWAQESVPILMMAKKFCSSGFHTNYFLAHVEQDDLKRSLSCLSVFGTPLRWQLTHVTAQDLISSGNTEPHLVITGNSLDGTYEDYMKISSPCIHHDAECPENKDNCRAIAASDQDRITLAIFADHRHYSFALVGEEKELGEEEAVGRLMEEVEPGMRETWQKAKDETMDLGTGFSLRTFMWQHVVLETVGRAAALMENHLEPLPLATNVPV